VPENRHGTALLTKLSIQPSRQRVGPCRKLGVGDLLSIANVGRFLGGVPNMLGELI
jgi:hypothetical protein